MSQLPTSGAINLNEIHVEAGGSSTSACTINDSDIRSLIGKSSEAQSDFADFYGAMAEEASTGTVAQTLTIGAGYQQYISWGYRNTTYNYGTALGSTTATTITGISGKTLLGITNMGIFAQQALTLTVDGKMSNANWSTISVSGCSGNLWNSSTQTFGRTSADAFVQSQNALAPSGWTTTWMWNAPNAGTGYQTLGIRNTAYSGIGSTHTITFA